MLRLRSTRARVRAVLAVLVLVGAGPARARPPAAPAPPAPPAPQDVVQDAPQEPRRVAAALFAEGTTLFKQWRFDEAEQRFREALTHEEHPIFHLYLSRALEKQGRLVEAHASLLQAVRPGAGSLPPGDVQVAGELQKSLESRLAQIEVSCALAGAEIFLDGQPWFKAPGRQRRMLAAGQHVLIARKHGYFPVTEPVSLIPGKQTRVVLSMTADVIDIERRWHRWRPWQLTYTGIAMSLSGGLLLWQARGEYMAIQRDLGACTPEASCSQIPQERLDSADSKRRLGTGALVGGGALVAVGIAGVLLNLPRTRRSEPAGGVETLELAPMVSDDTAGISASIRF